MLGDSEFDLVIYNVESVEKRDQYLAAWPSPANRRAARDLAAAPRTRTSAMASAAAIPVVVVDAHAPSVEGLPHVVGDDIAGGGMAATGHLLELGHRRIAFLGDEFDDPFGFTSSRHRPAGL